MNHHKNVRYIGQIAGEIPFGRMSVAANAAALYQLKAQERDNSSGQIVLPDMLPITMVTQELRDYYRGALRQFKTPLTLIGTPFQQAVWDAVREIPYGQTRSYGDIARAIGKPKAVRAVANAIGANPVWIIVPCHRIIQSDGGLGGYAGGIERKKWLLEHERRYYERFNSFLS